MTARDPNPHPAPANSNDDWQDWRPILRPAIPAARQASGWRSGPTSRSPESITKHYRPSQLPDHPTPESRGSVPAALATNSSDAALARRHEGSTLISLGTAFLKTAPRADGQSQMGRLTGEHRREIGIPLRRS
jgi:hypothetical protein